MVKKQSIAGSQENHVLKNVWDSYPDLVNGDNYEMVSPTLQKVIAEMFAPGEFYYYVLNLTDSTLSHHHERILPMHGLENYPNNLKDILDLIHPDDIPFVVEAERMCIEKMSEIGFEHQLNLKCAYCFRMKTGNGNYELFHHQAIHTLKDEQGRLLQSINIHSNIEHITSQNCHKVLVTGIGGRDDYHQMDCFLNKMFRINSFEKLTKRETQILSLIVQGFTGKEISNNLNISEHTTRTHRKNLLSKLQARNTSELVRKAIELALI